MIQLNDLAIILAKKIEAGLVSEFDYSSKARSSPSFYNIREQILKTLQEYMEVLVVEEKDSPYMLREMSPKQIEDYRNSQLESQAYRIVKRILDGPDYFSKFESRDEYGTWRNVTSSIVVLKTAKIEREEKIVHAKLLEESKLGIRGYRK